MATATRTAPCPYGACDGGGFVVDEERRVAAPCRCRPQQVERRRARSLSAVIPKKYRALAFDSPPVVHMPQAIVREIHRFARDVERHLDAGDGLWFEGDVGTGKTTLAMLVSRAALDAGRSVAIYSLPRLLAEIRDTFEADSHGSYVDFLDRLVAVDLLHVDDVGAEKTSPWVIEQLYAIVNGRYEEQKSIILTTNLDMEALDEQIGMRTVSRLKEMCEVFPLHGQDARAQLRSA